MFDSVLFRSSLIPMPNLTASQWSAWRLTCRQLRQYSQIGPAAAQAVQVVCSRAKHCPSPSPLASHRKPILTGGAAGGPGRGGGFRKTTKSGNSRGATCSYRGCRSSCSSKLHSQLQASAQGDTGADSGIEAAVPYARKRWLCYEPDGRKCRQQ